MTPGETVGALLKEAERFLDEHKVPESRASAEFLMASVLGAGRGEVAARASGSVDERRRLRFWGLVRKRSRRLPLAYVLGTQPFMGLEFEVTSDVLVPRPETEEVVESALKLADGMRPSLGRGVRALDIGTGSGCIALALAHRLPDAFIVATDMSRAALKVATKNAERLGLERRVRFIESDLFKPTREVSQSWADLAVSNPPYIPSSRIPRLAPEVLCEPRLALDGGKDGLDAIRAVIHEAPSMLRAGGWLVLEMDEGQGAAVRALLEKGGFGDVDIRRDVAGLERAAYGRLLPK
ncbi:MAG: peptide chain release factor N(5)-glutamine methyltransferase [Elusimicrobia bacterium]|nr:peptide chain release factor N(5)-glutamine methyltransferase [Elusimicrobiota bacterium]